MKNAGNSPLDYLEAQAVSYATTADHAAKLVIGLVAAGEDPRDFAGDDWVAKMKSYYDSATHRYGEQVIDQALYILARESLGLSAQSGTVAVLESMQLTDGCWEFADGFGCDTNSTAMAVQALVAAGVDSDDASIQAALDYFESAQNADGGFPYLIPSDSDANSTAFVLQALVAAGEDIDSGGPWEKPGGHTPMQALLGFQNATTGAFTYAGEDNAYATYQAVPALAAATAPPAAGGRAKTRPRRRSPPTRPRPRPRRRPKSTPTSAPSVVIAPAATPQSQVLPAAIGPTAMPRALAAAGEGGSAAGDSMLVAVAAASRGRLPGRRPAGASMA